MATKTSLKSYKNISNRELTKENDVIYEKLENSKTNSLIKKDSVEEAVITRNYLSKNTTIYNDQKLTVLIPKKKTLVLDLDETLIHSTFDNTTNYTYKINLNQEDSEKILYICKRPYLDEFLFRVSKIFDVYIFTAGLSSYANPVIDLIDPNRLIKKRYFRNDCIYWNGIYIKNLEILKKKLKDVIIIDNSPYCYCLQPNNAIPIESWYDDQDDCQLYNIIPLLTNLSQVEDVTEVIKNDNLDLGIELDELKALIC